MPTYSQANRPFRVYSTLGTDALLLGGFSGVEGVSMPFEFTIDLFSEDSAVDGQALLGSLMHLELDVPDTSTPRCISGHIRRFVQLGRHEQLTSYRAELVPKFWFLSTERDCRIFQRKTVIEIIQKILSEGDVAVDVRCTGSYPPREYCVQYRETDLDFVSRLMEEEGIFYFFEHAKGGETLVLADAPGAIAAVPGAAKVELMVAEGAGKDQNVITQLAAEHAVHTAAVTLRDYDPLQPSLRLEGAVHGSGKAEDYDYPGRFSKIDEGNRYARLRLERHETLREVVRGSGNVRAFTAGYKFDLVGHYRRNLNTSYALLAAATRLPGRRSPGVGHADG